MHALNTDGFALCIDLPAAARSGAAVAREWGLVLSPDEATLYAANPALGLVVEIDTRDPGVRRTARIPRGAIGVAPRLAVSPDGATLYVPTGGGVAALDTSTLAVRRTLLRGHRVSAVRRPRAARVRAGRCGRHARCGERRGARAGGDVGAAGCAGGGAAGAVAVVRSAFASLRGAYGRIEGRE